MQNRRRPIIAALLSFFATGLGQLYNGRIFKAASFVACTYLGYVVLSILLLDSFYGALLFMCFYVGIFFYMLMDAYRDAKAQSDYKLKPYNRWYIYVFYGVFLFFFLYRGTTHTLRKYCFEAFRFPSLSMVPTLIPGDHFIVKKLWLSGEHIKRGDLITFTLEKAPKTILLKRVVGLPGETIEIKSGKVFINSKHLNEPYALWMKTSEPQSENYSKHTIPENSLFVLGDNRDKSEDSRFFKQPFIPIERVTGKAIYIYWNWHSEENRAGIRLDSHSRYSIAPAQ